MLWVCHMWLLLSWGMSLLCLLSGEFFYHKWVLNFVKGFLCICGNNMVFIFQFVDMVYHINWFVNIEEFLHPWTKAHLIMMYYLFNMYWILFARICWGFLHLCSSVILACSLLFVRVASSSDFAIKSDSCGLVGWVWKFSFLCDFLEEFE